ncbi:MAG: class I SAM-dependent methyltransferase [Sandaracinaceae bacterium]
MPDADFWNDRYAEPGWAYGEAPNAFVASQADRFPTGSSVVELGSGEGRNAAFLAGRGCRVTAVDGSAEGLAKTALLPGGSAVETVEADVTAWTLERSWDGVVATFLHLPPAQRPALYTLVQRIVRPGGVVVAEWYQPEHRARGLYGGPPVAAAMVTAGELAEHFPEVGVVLIEEADVDLHEGTYHVGPSAVVRLVWERPDDGEPVQPSARPGSSPSNMASR